MNKYIKNLKLKKQIIRKKKRKQRGEKKDKRPNYAAVADWSSRAPRVSRK